MSSDEKALEEYDIEFGNLSKSIHPSITSHIKSFILKTSQESRKDGEKRERQRIIGLPCMEEEVVDVEMPGSAIPIRQEARNSLRRELKEEINI